MTTQQTTDLQTWLGHQDEAFPESLANVLIEDCLAELKNSEETSKKLGLLCNDRFDGFCIYEKGSRTFIYRPFKDYSNRDKVYITQTLLSQIDGKAVVSFLDVKINGIDSKVFNEINQKSYNNELDYNSTANDVIEETQELLNPKTLDHLLYREFTEALRIGKSLEEALESITQIYLKEKYV